MGEFLFSDDFAYAGPVRQLLDTGELQISDWTSMTLIGHIWIGSLVAYLFGFSFEILRFTELIFALIGIIGVYFLSKEFFEERKTALFISILFMFNPDFLLNSFGFMTDITFFAFIVWSVFFLVRFIKDDEQTYFFIGLILSLYALLIRDLALILPMSFIAAIIYKYGLKSRYVLSGILFLGLIVGEYLIFRYWFVNVHGPTASMDFSRNRIAEMIANPQLLIYTLGRNFVYQSVYMGFYLFPILLPVLFSILMEKSRTQQRIVFAVLITGFLVGAVFPLLSESREILMKNLLTGNQLIHTYVIEDVHNPSREFAGFNPSWLMSIMSAVSAIGFLSLWYILIDRFKNYVMKDGLFRHNIEKGPGEFVSLYFIIYFGLMLTQMMFTRYQIQIFAVNIIILAFFLKSDLPYKKYVYSASSVVMLFIIFSSIAATHDMTEFNRTRQNALNYLTEELKVNPAKIDGGFEYNAWHFYDFDYIKTDDKNWWWVQDDEYVVTWGRIAGYEIIREFEFHRWNPPCQKSKVYIYKRIN